MVIGSFFEYSSWLVKIEYLSVLSIWIYCFVNKWKRSKIMFSPFNFQILFFLFTLLIVSPAQYYYPMANTWTSISTEEFLKHLNEAYAVNLLGMAILGDKDYGGDGFIKNAPLILNLVDVRFTHPKTKQVMSFKAVPPENKLWTSFNLNKWFKL